MSSVTLEREELINIIDDQIRKNREKELSQGRVSFFSTRTLYSIRCKLNRAFD